MARKRISALRKKTGGPKKRITARQKAARRKNIEIARKHIRRTAGGKRKKLAGADTMARKAFAKKYKKLTSDRFVSKDYAKREAYKAAIGASKRRGTALAKRYAMGIAKTKFKINSKTGRMQFARGYIRSLTR